ncbi:hypothetical protein IAT40_001242 [Kwoniella sp. CBS 6097]
MSPSPDRVHETEPKPPCTPADITDLSPLHPVQYMIFDQLKLLAPVKLCRVSRSLNEELIPVIYDTTKLDKDNIELYMRTQIHPPTVIVNLPPVVRPDFEGLIANFVSHDGNDFYPPCLWQKIILRLPSSTQLPTTEENAGYVIHWLEALVDFSRGLVRENPDDSESGLDIVYAMEGPPGLADFIDEWIDGRSKDLEDLPEDFLDLLDVLEVKQD